MHGDVDSDGGVKHVNPFAITKAVDFTDLQITTHWVDWPRPGGFAEWIGVNSPTPRIIVGGKGTGRTHLMRHFSSSVQAIRGKGDSVGQVVADGVLGIYVLCSGINASRFSGRGQDSDAWQSVFAYYMDLWLAQASLTAFSTITEQHKICESTEAAITSEIRSLIFDDVEESDLWSIHRLRREIFELQARIDKAVNNAALNPDTDFDVEILANPGQLVFGIPSAIQNHCVELQDVLFLYLIDEFENFTSAQQRYVNSLIREKVPGTSFMVGVRAYGVRTHSTLTGEENRRGSEFDEFQQDRKYVDRDQRQYRQFCQRVVARRLAEHGLVDNSDFEAFADRLNAFFEIPHRSFVEDYIVQRIPPERRPCLTRLGEDLRTHGRDASGRALTHTEICMVTDAASLPARPLLEKINTFILYRAWFNGANLIDAAHEMNDNKITPDTNDVVRPNRQQQSVLQHFSTDLQAQLSRDANLPIYYAGIGEFIAMSDGLPRNLLVILKNIWRWARFFGEDPFRIGHEIPLECQRRGVLETADWFFEDSKPIGVRGEFVQNAVARLGEFFRHLRFSRKPSESSLASFSTDLSKCSIQAREIVHLAERSALLIEVDRGQRERNSGMAEPKFHLNRLLSPRWDLPVARRGAVRLSSDEVNAIFDPDMANQFESILNVRLARMNPPFGHPRSTKSDLQGELELGR